MRNTSRRVGLVWVTAVLVFAGAGFAQDWPQWRGPNRDGKASFTAPDSWPKALTQKWKVTVGTGDSTPALVGDKLYVFSRQGGDEVISCLDAASGKEVWKESYAAQAVTGAASRHPGPRSSPAVGDGKVVTLGVGGVLSCVGAADGKLAWRKEPIKGVPRFFTASSPIVVDGMAIAQVGSESNGGIVALDLASGEQKWLWTGEGPEYSSPVVMTAGDTKQIVALSAKSAVGLSAADGKLLWQVAFVPQRMAYNAATPIVDGAVVIISGSRRGTKALQIDKQGDGFAAKELWSNPEVAVQYNTPVLKDGLLFGLSDRSNLFCLDAKTGKTAWTDSASHGRGGFGSIVDAGSVLLALPSTSELIVYKPGKEYAEAARIKVADSAVYAHPVVSGKRVFVKDETSVTLWTVD